MEFIFHDTVMRYFLIYNIVIIVNKMKIMFSFVSLHTFIFKIDCKYFLKDICFFYLYYVRF